MFALAAGFCVAALPGRDLTPSEMIQNGLPSAKTMKSATKAEFLAAVCAAVRKHRSAAVAITPVAVAARREYAGEVVRTILRCDAKSDCKFVGAIVAAAISADGSATVVADAAIATAPDCAESIQNTARHVAGGPDDRADSKAAGSENRNLSSGSSSDASDGFDPREQLVLVCDAGMPRTVRESLLDEYLHAHPRAFLGSCPPTPTPVTNK